MADTPFRQDVYVYNESTGFVLTSAKQGGRWGEKLDDMEAARKGVRGGAFLALELYQDDPFVVRVVVGGELRPDEEAAWVDRFAARLKVPDGKLALCGGIEFLTGDEEEDGEFVRIVEIPKGDYRAEVYTLLPGVNGFYGNRDAELADYWRRTRPGETPPAWIEGTVPESPRLVDFVVRLTPATDALPPPAFSDDEYWFPIAANRRLPEKCPVGLMAEGPFLGDG